LLALAAVHVAAAAIWRRLGTAEGAHAFATSFAFRALGAALLLDAAVALLRALPLAERPGGRVALVLPDRRGAGGLVARAGQALVALGFVASLLARDRLVFRVAEGETFEASPEQLVERDPPRSMSPGPFPVRLAVEPLPAEAPGDGRAGLEATLADDGGERRRASARFPAWYGWGRFLRPVRSGWAVRWELAAPGGGLLDTAFAKLDLVPEGRWDELRLQASPHRVHLRLAPGAAQGAGRPPPLEAVVHRGRLLVAAGAVGPAEALAFEGLAFRVPEARRWVELEMVRDPGIPLALLGAAAVLAGLALRGRAKVP
ncbi:MAG TPA: hypothetical protein VLS93_12170, partial [Anaeromyxobacteraceae bacterium]|nr:hypothetical protein [Anaeromyxobacteraceae bacterium]